jgi:hypothetical protein
LAHFGTREEQQGSADAFLLPAVINVNIEGLCAVFDSWQPMTLAPALVGDTRVFMERHTCW